MRRNHFYLEAPELTQELLTIKWTLKSAGFSIGSTWHEGQVSALALTSKDHWNAWTVQQIQSCDSLVVICGKNDRAAAELAMMAGLALARGLKVIWIGSPVRSLKAFGAVCQFNTAEEYRKQVLQKMYFSSAGTEVGMAA